MKTTLVTITAILTVGGLEAIALLKGIDGALFTLAATLIGGLGGYEIRSLKAKADGK